MRVPDTVLKSVGYVCEVTHRHADNRVEGEPIGTGFFVCAQSQRSWWHFFITAKHVAEDLVKRRSEVYVQVNTKSGGVTSFRPDQIDNIWRFHPTDQACDIAITMCHVQPDMDTVSIPVSMFAVPDLIPKLNIGPGDEVFMPGLFTMAPGESQNLPIIRHGNIAMLPPPSQQIQTDRGFSNAYLIEARSIGGMSGSPVFVRETVGLPLKGKEGKDDFTLLGSGNMYFLGAAHGHWDIRESEINKYDAIHDRPRGVNMGIGVVIPAYKILEALYQPAISDIMRADDERKNKLDSTGD